MNGGRDFSQVCFVETEAYRAVLAAITFAINLERPVRVIGGPGVGKTVALQKVARDTHCGYLCIDQRSKSAAGMYEAMLAAFGLHPNGRYLRDLHEQAIHELKPTYFDAEYVSAERRWRVVRHPSRVLLVDEYQAMEQTALRELLWLCERVQLPLVLCGNGERLAQTRTNREALLQIQDRIASTTRVGKPVPTDCVSLAVEFDVQGKDAYEAVSAYGCRTSLRQLHNLLDVARVITSGRGSIQFGHLETAIRQITGRDDAVALLASPKGQVGHLPDPETDQPKRIAKARS
jgi:DNA transposition AAA+ family ATPase